MYDGKSIVVPQAKFETTTSGNPSSFKSPIDTPHAPTVSNSCRLSDEKPEAEPQTPASPAPNRG